jgi:hypothetical protein
MKGFRPVYLSITMQDRTNLYSRPHLSLAFIFPFDSIWIHYVLVRRPCPASPAAPHRTARNSAPLSNLKRGREPPLSAIRFGISPHDLAHRKGDSIENPLLPSHQRFLSPSWVQTAATRPSETCRRRGCLRLLLPPARQRVCIRVSILGMSTQLCEAMGCGCGDMLMCGGLVAFGSR